MIRPTIGRRVWYWPSDFDRAQSTTNPPSVIAQGDVRQPCDAGVVYVHNERLVNLTVADHNGVMHSRCSVQLVQPEDVPPHGAAYATWMDYQVGNAS